MMELLLFETTLLSKMSVVSVYSAENQSITHHSHSMKLLSIKNTITLIKIDWTIYLQIGTCLGSPMGTKFQNCVQLQIHSEKDFCFTHVILDKWLFEKLHSLLLVPLTKSKHFCCIVIMVSITKIQIQGASFVSDTNGFINSWLQFMAIRGERLNSWKSVLTILCWPTLPQRVAHLVMFKISIHLCRSEKLSHMPQW